MPTTHLNQRLTTGQVASRLWGWIKNDFLGIAREMRWSYLPPLMVYFAAGVAGFTGIIESFFVKEELGLTAAFLAGLGFWAGLPWALKMPVGHLVDLFWRWKSIFVYLGTKYLNKIFAIHRAQYDELGMLMITAALIGLTIPVAAVVLFNPATGLTWKTIKRRSQRNFAGNYYGHR